ncbi:MAG: hypothetical protein ABWZ88_16770, partial [Variovorax sp.]
VVEVGERASGQEVRFRDPVAPAVRSQSALDKAAGHTVDDGTPAHSFSTLMAELGAIVRNTVCGQ